MASAGGGGPVNLVPLGHTHREGGWCCSGGCGEHAKRGVSRMRPKRGIGCVHTSVLRRSRAARALATPAMVHTSRGSRVLTRNVPGSWWRADAQFSLRSAAALRRASGDVRLRCGNSAIERNCAACPQPATTASGFGAHVPCGLTTRSTGPAGTGLRLGERQWRRAG